MNSIIRKIIGVKYLSFRAITVLEDREDYEQGKIEIYFERRNNRKVILANLSLDTLIENLRECL